MRSALKYRCARSPANNHPGRHAAIAQASAMLKNLSADDTGEGGFRSVQDLADPSYRHVRESMLFARRNRHPAVFHSDGQLDLAAAAV